MNNVPLAARSRRKLSLGLWASLLLGFVSTAACVEGAASPSDYDERDEDEDSDEFRSSALLLSPVADAYVKERYPNLNFGTTGNLLMRKKTIWDKRSLIKFELPAPGDALLAAELYVCGLTNLAGNTYKFSARYVHDDSWTEAGVTWNNQPDGSIAPGDPEEHSTVPELNQCKWVPLTASRVQQEIDGDGVLSLKLVRGSLVPSNQTELSLGSREHGTASMRPQLRLTFDLAPPPPPPPPPNSGDCCTENAYASCEVPAIQQCVCDLDDFCCLEEWDDLCVESAIYDCAANC